MITTKETHRLGTSVNIAVLDAKGKTVYDRYVDAADWDGDPKSVTAQIADYLAKKPQPEVASAAVNKNAVTMTDAEVTAKLTEIADAEAVAASDTL